MFEFFEEHKDLLNFLLALGTASAGGVAVLVRWLFKRLKEEIRFSPATALGIGYFQNFLMKVGPELTRNTPVLIDGRERALTREQRKLHIYLPENLPKASHQGVEEYKFALDERGLKLVRAEIVTESRAFPFHAIVSKTNPDEPPVLFDYPTALGNMVDVLNYHCGENVFTTEKTKRLKLEAREIQNFSAVLTQLIRDKNLERSLIVTFSDPATFRQT